MDLGSLYLSLSCYIRPISIVLGVIGALLNLALFRFRKSLRANSCALYFRALSINDLCVLCYVIGSQWLSDQFDINPTTQYNWYCKLANYLTYPLYTLSPYLLVLACFDRLCTSSAHAKVRRLATMRAASILICSVTILIFLSQTYLIMGSQILTLPMHSFCTMSSDLYNQMLLFSVGILFCFLPPLLMILFSSLTYVSLRRQRNRIMPVNQARSRHRDTQLLKMLGIYVVWNIVCVAPFSITYFIQLQKNDNLFPLGDPSVMICTILVNITYASSFYIYTLGTPFYREELWKMMSKCLRRIYRFNHRHKHEHEGRVTQ